MHAPINPGVDDLGDQIVRIVESARCLRHCTGQGDVDFFGPEEHVQEGGIGSRKTAMSRRVLGVSGRNSQGEPVGIGHRVVVSICIPSANSRYRAPEIKVVLRPTAIRAPATVT